MVYNKFYHNKIFGIQIIDNGSGKFYNNNFFDNGGQNWVIEDSAGEIVREDNSPNWWTDHPKDLQLLSRYQPQASYTWEGEP